ncbi:hypothetical protein ACTUVN_004608 [Pseudomonas caspiana]
MTVTVKIPDELEAEILEVMYRSPICKRIKYDSSGQPIELEGYHGINVKLQREGLTDLYSAQLPMDGGGACKWHLSNIMFGIAHANPTRFGENVTYGAGGGVIVMFDHDRPSLSSGLPIKVEGDVIIKKAYYPWVDEDFLGAYKKTVSLVGEGSAYLMYQALQARKVYFEPTLHSAFVIYSSGPKVKKDGNYTSYTYPDGTVVADGGWHPSFRKLQVIRLAAENQK